MVYLPVNEVIALSNGGDDGTLVANLQTLAQDFHLYGLKLMVTFSDATLGEGPIEAGWAQSQLTNNQILECRDAVPTSQWDVVANEQGRRKVRAFGTSSGLTNDSLNDGRPVWKRMFLKVPAGQVLAQVYTINRSGAQLTTGQLVHFQGQAIGKWA